MTHVKTFSTCLIALALHSAAWAEIYETTDAQGNPVFSDSPPGPDAEVIDLPQTNIIEAHTPEQQAAAPHSDVDEKAPSQENRTATTTESNNNEEGAYDQYLRHDQAYERVDPAAPHEVLNAEAPREVGDSNSQMPREVGDSDSQVPYEVGDFDSQVPQEVSGADSQMAPEVGGVPIRHRKAVHHR